MCLCGLVEGTHWYVDLEICSYRYLVATTPEQAELALRSWAGRILKSGNMHLDIRSLAAKILSTRVLHLTAVCDNPMAHESFFSDGMEIRYTRL